MGKGPGEHRIGRLRPAQWRSGFTLVAATFLFLLITPRAGTQQLSNVAPSVVATIPPDGATQVAPTTTLSVTFSEPVTLAAGAVSLICPSQQTFELTIAGGPTTYTILPAPPLPPGESCTATVFAYGVTDLDNPPAHMGSDTVWRFTVAAAAAVDVLINEVDATTAGPEFIELYDGGSGRTSLTNLQVALYDGRTDTIITTIPLRDKSTDADGYFLLSSDPATADLLLAAGSLLDGPAAVALYAAAAGTLPNGSPPVLTGLIDAVVYGSGPADSGLLPLLLTGQPQVDENSRGQAASDSVQRCPNGAGGLRQTTAFEAGPPTPGTVNGCLRDAAPVIESKSPAAGMIVEPDLLQLEVSFSEPVLMSPGALLLTCALSGDHALTVTGGPTTFYATPTVAPQYGESCAATLVEYLISDVDSDDPPDHPVSSDTWSFSMAKRVATNILINEVDSDTPGQDTAEFIELYDGGQGQTDLSGLVVVLFNGATDTSYRAISLDTHVTNNNGYFVVGNKAVANRDLLLPDAALQNGPDAIALYVGRASDFPTGTAVTTSKLIDAVVYGPRDKPDQGLLSLLLAGQAQVDESERGLPEQHAVQRCPNGSGGQRQTATYRPNNPTPGKTNVCTTDDPPRVINTVPASNANGIAPPAQLSVTFSEAVTLKQEWFALSCDKSGIHTTTTSGGPTSWTISLTSPVVAGETCKATVYAAQVTDSDSDDPPDVMVANSVWSFSTKAIAVADFILINELDANTPGVDKAEFVELYDGGVGRTPLDGLTLVLFNGSGAVSYAAVGLDGYQTNALGYFVIGNAAVSPNLVISDGTLQNGPDAAGLFAAAPSAFPSGTGVSTDGLIDAVVYGNDAAAELRVLLNSGQPAVDEGSAGAADTHSLQRCPDGSGGRRNSVSIGTGNPTPGAANRCLTDDPPRIVTTSPAADATGVAIDTPIDVTFSEPVSLAAKSVKVNCDKSGSHDLTVSGGPTVFRLKSTPLLAAEHCLVTIPSDSVSDLDSLDPPDAMTGDVSWGFQTAGPVATGILINEFDVDTPGVDTAEFIELFDGGRGHTPLDGLVVVLFNGQGDISYRTVDLSGTQTDAAGYIVIGGPDVTNRTISLPSQALQNGPDAIALYAGDPGDYPNNTAISTQALLDAVVYGTGDPVDSGLLSLLLSGQPQIDESSLGDPAAHANQRCPNGAGGARTTAGFQQATPTPGAANPCRLDSAPTIVALSPADAAVAVSPNTTLTVTFSEPVTATANWLQLSCVASGPVVLTITGGPLTFTATPVSPLAPGERCTASVSAADIHDVDSDDPPDTPAADVTWSFSVAPALCEQPTTSIQAVQGAGFTSPLLGDNVTIEVVVTADFRASLGGLFVQAPDDAAREDNGGSVGLFVRLAPKAGAIKVGDRVILSGRVAERDQRTTLDGATVVALCGLGEKVAPLKFAPTTSPVAWEAVESMLVTVGPAVIADNSALGTEGVLSLTDGQRPMYPTEMLPPGDAAQVALQENQQRQWLLDDGSFSVPAEIPGATAGPHLRAGDTLPSSVGVVDGFADERRIHALEQPQPLASNPRPLAPPTQPAGLRLVSVDLDLFSNGDGQGGFVDPDGARSAAEYQRQSAKIVAMLTALDADIIALNGLENDGVGPTSTLADLLHELNSAIDPPYAAVTADDAPANRLFAMHSVLLYRPASVSATAQSVPADIAAGAGHVAQPLLARVTDSASGQQFDVALIHLRHRGDCPPGGSDADQHDGQACHNAARSEAAAAFTGWLGARATAPQTLLVGSWNAYALENPVQIATAAGFHDKTPSNDYTQVQDGQTGAAQRLLVGSSLGGQFAQTAIWHINADESPIFDYRLDNPPALFAPDPYRSAATDPLIVDLRLGGLVVAFTTPPTVLIGQTSEFRNTSTGPGPLQFRWDFGDGSPPATTFDASHTYQRIGTYTVALTVSNSAGSETVSARIDVLPRRIYLPAAAALRPLHQASTQR